MRVLFWVIVLLTLHHCVDSVLVHHPPPNRNSYTATHERRRVTLHEREDTDKVYTSSHSEGNSTKLPVVIVHGWFSTNVSMGLSTLIDNIQTTFPGTDVYSLDIFTNIGSLAPLTTQLPIWSKDILALSAAFPNGFNMIGFSQGGLIGRLLLEEMSNHTVQSYISLSGPLMGQYGLPNSMQWMFPNYTTTNLYKLLYTDAMQDSVSLANFWKDPENLDLYLKLPVLLATYNNEVMTNKSAEYKANFLRVSRLVTVAGPDDGVVVPWQSSLFAFFDQDHQVVNMTSQAIYTNDTFGLRTLNERGGIVPCIVPGVDHYHFTTSTQVFKQCVAPNLLP